MDHAKYTRNSGALVGLGRGVGRGESTGTMFLGSVLCPPEGGHPKPFRDLLVPTLISKSLEVITPVLTTRQKLITLKCKCSSYIYQGFEVAGLTAALTTGETDRQTQDHHLLEVVGAWYRQALGNRLISGARAWATLRISFLGAGWRGRSPTVVVSFYPFGS